MISISYCQYHDCWWTGTTRDQDIKAIFTNMDYLWYYHGWIILWPTRQNSTQSIGNMPLLASRHLLQHIRQMMPRNPKYNQFQSKGHHNEENPQTMTKNAWKPNIWPVSLIQKNTKIRKITRRLWPLTNLISSESGKDTVACKIPGNSLQAFSKKLTPNLKHFAKSKLSQNLKIQQIMTIN